MKCQLTRCLKSKCFKKESKFDLRHLNPKGLLGLVWMMCEFGNHGDYDGDDDEYGIHRVGNNDN
jgi:hypothetical protein